MTILHASIWAVIPIPELCATSYQLPAPLCAVGSRLLQFREVKHKERRRIQNEDAWRGQTYSRLAWSVLLLLVSNLH